MRQASKYAANAPSLLALALLRVMVMSVDVVDSEHDDVDDDDDDDASFFGFFLCNKARGGRRRETKDAH